MSVESTRKVMKRYWDSGLTDLSVLADDAVYTMMATGEEARGPEAILQMIEGFYRGAFDARPETQNEIFADGQAVVEGFVVGKHTGEFASILATGKEIRVPLCVVYDLENDQIQRARIYFEVPVLLQQIGAEMGSN